MMADQKQRAAVRAAMVTSAIYLIFAAPQVAMAQQAGTEPTEEPQAGSEAAPTSAVVAQSPSVPDYYGDEIIVTARRTAESQQKVPIAITTLTAQDLIDNNVRDVVDIQSISPGLTVSTTNSSGRAKLTIRGQSEADDKLTADRSVGVYIDGVSFERQYGLRASLIDIAQIEVLRGPQGTLFGRNTTGGALNIITQHPTYEWGGYVDLVYGSYNNAQALAVINAPLIDDKLSLRAVGQVISREGYYTEFDGHDSNDDNTMNGRVLLRADPTENISILLSGDYVRIRNTDVHFNLLTDNMIPARLGLLSIAAELGVSFNQAYEAWRVFYDAQQRDIRLGFGDPPDRKDDLDHYGFSANIEVELGGTTISSITSYRNLSRATNLDLDATPFDLIVQRGTTDAEYVSQEIQLSSSQDGFGLDWQAGLFFHRETGNEFSAADNLFFINRNRSAVTENDVVNSSRAAYAQAVYNLSPQLRATGGIRYTEDTRKIDAMNRIDLTIALPPLPPGGVSRCNLLAPALGGPVFPNCTYRAEADFNKITWLLGADWRPVEEIMVYGSVSTGYRAGGFTPSGGDVINSVAALDAAFTPYRPETVTNYELGVKSDVLDRRLRLNGSFFYQDYKDVQKRIRDSVNNVFVTLIRNAASATLYGGELELTARPIRGLTLDANAAYLHAEYNDYFALDASGNLLDLTSEPFEAPEWTFNLGASYEIPLMDGAIGLHANYGWMSSVNLAPGTPDAAGVTQPSYGLLDGRINWHVDSQDLDVALFAKNLTDVRYIADAANVTSVGWNFGFPGAPRTLGIQFRKSF